MRNWLLSLTLSLVLLTPGLASAHKVIISVYTEGKTLEGEVGFSNGQMAAEKPLTITAPDGSLLGNIITDADGFFTFTPTQAVPHLIKADLGAGHVILYEVTLAELPYGLVQSATGTNSAPQNASASETATPSDTALDQSELRAMIEAAVARQIRPLRQELAAAQNQRSFQQVLGGLGFILGLVGIAALFLAYRKKESAPSNPSQDTPHV